MANLVRYVFCHGFDVLGEKKNYCWIELSLLALLIKKLRRKQSF